MGEHLRQRIRQKQSLGWDEVGMFQEEKQTSVTEQEGKSIRQSREV
jgi:hypothetical protein